MNMAWTQSNVGECGQLLLTNNVITVNAMKCVLIKFITITQCTTSRGIKQKSSKAEKQGNS